MKNLSIHERHEKHEIVPIDFLLTNLHVGGDYSPLGYVYTLRASRFLKSLFVPFVDHAFYHYD